MFFNWLTNRRQAASLALADAGSLIYVNGRDALAEARRRERVSIFTARELRDHQRDRAHWRRVASIIETHTCR